MVHFLGEALAYSGISGAPPMSRRSLPCQLLLLRDRIGISGGGKLNFGRKKNVEKNNVEY
jgi:hypothetical protein